MNVPFKSQGLMGSGEPARCTRAPESELELGVGTTARADSPHSLSAKLAECACRPGCVVGGLLWLQVLNTRPQQRQMVLTGSPGLGADLVPAGWVRNRCSG